jgi:glutamyl-tRNA synthetase
MAYKEMGFLPEALVNYLVRLGWSHGDQEIFSLAELIELFSLDAVGKSPAIFNPEKLLWLNAHYIKEAKPDRLQEEMKPLWPEGAGKADPDFTRKVIANMQPRAKTLVELATLADFYFAQSINYDNEAGRKFLLPDVTQYLKDIIAVLPSSEGFSKEVMEAFLRDFTEKRNIKFKIIAQPLRVALTGKTVSPGIDEVMVTLGKERVTKRIKDAVAYIEASNKP